jgi:hypothetical protein
MRQKQLMAAMAAAVVDSLKQNSATGQGLVMNSPPAGLQHVQATLNDMMAGPMAGPPMPGQAQPGQAQPRRPAA